MSALTRNLLHLGAGAVVLVALGLYLLPREGPRREVADLPWRVEALPDGTYRVFGLVLGRATLQDAVRKLGEPEAVALFVSPDGERSLEAYFGRRTLGGLEARIIVVLDIPQGFEVPAGPGEPQPSGARKYPLPRELWPRLASQPIAVLTYSPTYSGLDETYLVTRFGSPEARRSLEAGRIRLEYPNRGLTLHRAPKGREVFDYLPPGPHDDWSRPRHQRQDRPRPGTSGHVTVGDLLFSGVPHVDDLDVEMRCEAARRVVAIHDDHLFAHLGDGDPHGLCLRTAFPAGSSHACERNRLLRWEALLPRERGGVRVLGLRWARKGSSFQCATRIPFTLDASPAGGGGTCFSALAGIAGWCPFRTHW